MIDAKHTFDHRHKWADDARLPYLGLVADVTSVCGEAVVLNCLLHDHTHKTKHICLHFLVRPKLVAGILSEGGVSRRTKGRRQHKHFKGLWLL